MILHVRHLEHHARVYNNEGVRSFYTDQLRAKEAEMKAAAKELAFERAAELRNQIRALKLKDLNVPS